AVSLLAWRERSGRGGGLGAVVDGEAGEGPGGESFAPCGLSPRRRAGRVHDKLQLWLNLFRLCRAGLRCRGTKGIGWYLANEFAGTGVAWTRRYRKHRC